MTLDLDALDRLAQSVGEQESLTHVEIARDARNRHDVLVAAARAAELVAMRLSFLAHEAEQDPQCLGCGCQPESAM